MLANAQHFPLPIYPCNKLVTYPLLLVTCYLLLITYYL